MSDGLFILITLALLAGGVTALYHIIVEPIIRLIRKRTKKDAPKEQLNEEERQTRNLLLRTLTDIGCQAEAVKDQIKEATECNFDRGSNGLISKESIAQKDGLYLFECRGDNHMFGELYKYRKGERIWRYFENENKRFDGWALVTPRSYEYISESDIKWQTGLTAPVWGLYIVAYAFQDKAEEHYGFHSSYECVTFLNIEKNKKNYAFIFTGPDESFVDSLKSCRTSKNNQDINWENIKIISFYLFYDYSEQVQQFCTKTGSEYPYFFD